MKNMRFLALALLALVAIPAQSQVIIGGGGGGGGSPCNFANPTATSATAAVNGVATTCMRSDAAPALGTTTGSGSLVRGTGPTLSAPVLGTPASGDATNMTNIPVNQAKAGAILPAANGGAGIVNGVMKANGSGTVSAAAAGTDYAAATSGSAVLSGNGSGGFTNVTVGACLNFSTPTLAGTYVIDARTTTTEAITAAAACKLVTFNNGSATAASLVQATGSAGAGFSFDVQNLGAGTVTITPTTSTINGSATLVIAQNKGCTITSDGTNYQVSACTAIGAGSGTVTTTGSPASGNLATFSGASSVTNGDLSGDATTSGTLTVVVAKINGTAVAASPSTHQVGVVTAANTSTWKTMPDCTDTGGNHINFTQSTDAFSCGTSGGGGGNNPGGSGTELQFRGGASTFSALTNSATTTTGLNLGSTVAPVDALDIDQGTFAIWNTTDHVTNFDKFACAFSGAILTCKTTGGGTGTARSVVLTGSGLTLNAQAGSFAVQTGGSNVLTIQTNGLLANNAAGPKLANLAATATVPTLNPNQASTTTGIGAQASGNMSFIAGGAEISRVTATATTQIAGLTVLKNYTVAGLPAGITGGMAYVTDATACTYGAAPTGGGSTFCPEIYNGATWQAF